MQIWSMQFPVDSLRSYAVPYRVYAIPFRLFSSLRNANTYRFYATPFRCDSQPIFSIASLLPSIPLLDRAILCYSTTPRLSSVLCLCGSIHLLFGSLLFLASPMRPNTFRCVSNHGYAIAMQFRATPLRFRAFLRFSVAYLDCRKTPRFSHGECQLISSHSKRPLPLERHWLIPNSLP